MKPAFLAAQSNFKSESVYAFQRRESSFLWNWHYHPELELTWISKGGGTRLVGDHSAPYKAGDLVLLGPNLPHTWFTAESEPRALHAAVVIQFRVQAIPDALQNLPEFNMIQILLLQAARGVFFKNPLSAKIVRLLLAMPDQSEFTRWMTLLELLSELCALPKEMLASNRYRHQRSYNLSTRLSATISFIEQNCREELPLSKVASRAGLTTASFSRFFRRMTNQTFVDFRNSCRIREACRLLTETERAITEIAFESGFSNLANFNRRFKSECRMSPGTYRRLHNPLSVQT